MNKIISISALVIALFCLVLQLTSSGSKVGYVELNRVYNEYNYAKELLTKHEDVRKGIIQEKDSLSQLLNSLITEKDQYKDTAGVVGYYMRALNERIQNIESALQTDKDQINEKILNQINREMERFGKRGNYHVIMGAKGDGTLMYADEKVNLTQDFINFLNTPE